ncbi:FMRFamide receptor-like [Littorina saxatilis]|uniref:FMRFamide receptor-like n=1 Tax=Littorina saxatilis TaxID=31220 RepID=UPI0038B5FC46
MDNSTTNEIPETLMPLSTDNPLEEVLANQNSLFFTPDPVSEATLNLVTDILVCHVVPMTSAFGIVGNVLSIVVLLSQKKGQSLDFLLIVLAFVDACFLIFQSLGFVACSIRQNDVIAARNFLVITLPHVLWIGITLSRISSMLTVVIAVERCLVVMLPLKVKVWVTSTSIRVTTALACVIPVIAHIPVFMRGEIEWLTHPRLNTTLPNLKLTQFALDNPEFLNVYKNLVLNVVFRYVPMATVSTCTGLTIAQLKRYSRWRMSSANDQRDRATICERDARISVTLLRV